MRSSSALWCYAVMLTVIERQPSGFEFVGSSAAEVSYQLLAANLVVRNRHR
jgi:hypothetical protein